MVDQCDPLCNADSLEVQNRQERASVEARRVLGERVRMQRGQLGWTQAQLADALTEHGWPVDPTAVVRIEKGERAVQVEQLLVLAAALGTTPSDLLTPDHPGTLTVGTREVTEGRVEAWFAGDPDALARRVTRTPAELHDDRYGQHTRRVLSDLVDEVDLLARAMDANDRAAMIWAAARAHNALSAITELALTDDDLVKIARRYNLDDEED
jgi:transcriptional regulator with XRE-family HTH domain